MADEMITIDASALSSFDYSTFIYNYFSSEVVGSTAGASSYYGGVPYYGGTQVGFKYGGTTNNAQVVLQGENIAYDGVLGPSYGHGISGTVDGFALGYYDENTTSTVVNAETGEVSELQGVIPGLVVSGLDYTAAVGTGTGADNPVNTIYNALRKANTLVDLNGDTVTGYEYVDQIYQLLSAKAQHFIGTAGADNYVGTAFGDLIDGGAGADTMVGGAGDDIYVVDDRGDVMTEEVDGGNDTIMTAISHYLIRDNIENIIQTGEAGQFSYGNDLNNTMTAVSDGGYLYGQGGNDTLIGGDGADTLDGGTGVDVMTGGAGDDTYYVDDAADVINEVDGGGKDEVATSLANYTLSKYLENLTLLGSEEDGVADADLNGTGNAAANTIVGNGGSNTLSGISGNDTIYGGAGNDTIKAGNGADKIYGGLGVDLLTGANGKDTFFFATGDTASGRKSADTITDFHSKQHDRIDVSGIDANENKKGDQAFDFIGSDAFSHHAGELRYVKTADDTYIAGDTDGNGKADFTIHLDGAFNMHENFFVL